MDNVQYYSVKKETIPNTSTRKANIIKWFQENGASPKMIAELLEMVRQSNSINDRYLCDDLAETH